MENWQEEFDKRFAPNGKIIAAGFGSLSSEIKAFIQSLLDSQKQEILEKIKLEEKTEGDGWEILEHCCPGDDVANGYNQAISDLEKLKKTL
jgi:hypothetical protein